MLDAIEPSIREPELPVADRLPVLVPALDLARFGLGAEEALHRSGWPPLAVRAAQAAAIVELTPHLEGVDRVLSPLRRLRWAVCVLQCAGVVFHRGWFAGANAAGDRHEDEGTDEPGSGRTASHCVHPRTRRLPGAKSWDRSRPRSFTSRTLSLSYQTGNPEGVGAELER